MVPMVGMRKKTDHTTKRYIVRKKPISGQMASESRPEESTRALAIEMMLTKPAAERADAGITPLARAASAMIAMPAMTLAGKVI